MDANMFRAEDKYCCAPGEMYELQERLNTVLRTDSNENDAEGYRVVSLYFDDLADTCLRDTQEGSYHRRKYRIRIYNDSLAAIKLEVKEKRGNRIRKLSRGITPEELHSLMNGQCIRSSFSPEDPGFLFNLAIQTKLLRPRVIVTYERKAFIYTPGNVRITFDRNVRASQQIEAFGTPDILYDHLRDQDAVLEIKYDELIPGFILQLLELNFPLQSAYSKYQLCREHYQN